MRPAPLAYPPPASAPLPRKAFVIGDVIGHTFSAWWHHVVPFSLLSVFANAPVFLLGLLSGTPIPGFTAPATNPFDRAALAAEAARATPQGFWLAYAVTMLLFLVVAGAITHGVIHHLAGKPVSLGSMVATGIRRFLPLLAVGVICYVIIVLGLVLLIVPGVFLACALAAAVPAVVVERPGIFGAIKRSFALTRGRRFAIFVAFLVFLVVAFTVSMLGSILLPLLTASFAPLAGTLVGLALNVVFGTLLWVAPGVIYHDLRVSKEGVDTVQLAAVFD